MSFDSMLRDRVTLVKPDGTAVENIKASVQPNMIFIHDEKLPLEEKDTLYRKLPNGLIEAYVVLDRGFHSAFQGIPGHYQAKVRKEGSINQQTYSSITNIYNANGPNARISIGGTDSSTNIIATSELFEQLRKVLQGIEEPTLRNHSTKVLNELETAKATSTFTAKYKEFIGILADHVSIVAPFIPALSQLLQ